MTPADDERWFDQLAINDVTVRYSDAVTRSDWDAFEATWMPDAVWEENADSTIVGARAIRDHVAATLDKCVFMIQTTHGTVVEFDGPDRASATTTIHALARIGDISIVNYGIYYSDLVKVDGVWRFARRSLQVVYSDTSPLDGMVGITRAELMAKL
jgi:hypothetical protein